VKLDVWGRRHRKKQPAATLTSCAYYGRYSRVSIARAPVKPLVSKPTANCNRNCAATTRSDYRGLSSRDDTSEITSSRGEIVSGRKLRAGPTLAATISGPALAAVSLSRVSGDACGSIRMERAIRAKAQGPIRTRSSGTPTQGAGADQDPERLCYGESFHGAPNFIS
jgi:hypothetical protein